MNLTRRRRRTEDYPLDASVAAIVGSEEDDDSNAPARPALNADPWPRSN